MSSVIYYYIIIIPFIFFTQKTGNKQHQKIKEVVYENDTKLKNTKTRGNETAAVGLEKFTRKE
jgi:hypothetical protein